MEQNSVSRLIGAVTLHVDLQITNKSHLGSLPHVQANVGSSRMSNLSMSPRDLAYDINYDISN